MALAPEQQSQIIFNDAKKQMEQLDQFLTGLSAIFILRNNLLKFENKLSDKQKELNKKEEELAKKEEELLKEKDKNLDTQQTIVDTQISNEQQQAQQHEKTKTLLDKFNESVIASYEHFKKFHDDYEAEMNKFEDIISKRIYGSVKKGESIFKGGLLANIEKFKLDPNFGNVIAQRIKDKVSAPFKKISVGFDSILPGAKMFGSIFAGLFKKTKDVEYTKTPVNKIAKSDNTDDVNKNKNVDNTISFNNGALGIVSNLLGFGNKAEGEIESDSDVVARQQKEDDYRANVLRYLSIIAGKEGEVQVAVSSEKKEAGKGLFQTLFDTFKTIKNIAASMKSVWRYISVNARWMSRASYWRGLGGKIVNLMRSPLMRFAGGAAGAMMMAADAIGGVNKSAEWLGKKDGNTTAGKVSAGIGGALGGTGPGLFDKGSAGDKMKNIGAGAAKGAMIGMMFGPWGALIGGGIGALFAAIGGKNIAKALNTLWKGIKWLFGAIWKGITSWWNVVKPVYAAIWKGIKFVFGGIWTGIKAVFGGIFDVFSGIWSVIKGIFTGDGKGIMGGIKKIWNVAKWLNPLYLAYRVGEMLWNWASGLVSKVLGWFGLGEESGESEEDSGGFFSKLWNIAKWLNPLYLAYRVGEMLWNWAYSAVTSVLSWFGIDLTPSSEGGRIWDTVKKWAEWLNPFSLMKKVAAKLGEWVGGAAKAVLGWFGFGDDEEEKPEETAANELGTKEENVKQKKNVTKNNIDDADKKYDKNVLGDSKYFTEDELVKLDKIITSNEREGLTIEAWVDKYGLDKARKLTQKSYEVNPKRITSSSSPAKGKYEAIKSEFLSDNELARDEKYKNTRRGVSLANVDKVGTRGRAADTLIANAQNRRVKESINQSPPVQNDSSEEKVKYIATVPVFVNQNKSDYLDRTSYPVS